MHRFSSNFNLVDSKKSKMKVKLEEILFLMSLALLVCVILGGVLAMCWTKAKRMSAAAIEDIESKMATYELSCELVHEEFAEYLRNAIDGCQQRAVNMLPKRCVVSDAQTEMSIQKMTVDASSQTDNQPPPTLGALGVKPEPATETERPASPVPGRAELPTTLSLPTVITVKPAVRTQSTIRFIGSHPVI